MFVAGWMFHQEFVVPLQDVMDIKDVFLCMDEMYCIIIYTNVTCCKYYSFENLMYPILKIAQVLDFLDTSSMSVTFGIRAGRFRSCHGSFSYN
jgi:hypothetical protein